MQRYHRLVAEAVMLDIIHWPDRVELRFSGLEPLYRYTTETALVSVMAMIRGLINTDIHPLAVQSTFPEPKSVEAYREYFQCPLRFDASSTCLIFDRATLQMEIPSVDERIAELNDQAAEQALNRLPRQEGEQLNIRYWLLQALAVETPTREWVARALGMSVSSLQRRLQEQGSSFKQALELLRKELALDYLRQGLSLPEITSRLSYREQSNFQRAFKRWYGMPPHAYLRELTVVEGR
jgi:AraC-like DNA-binding protein